MRGRRADFFKRWILLVASAELALACNAILGNDEHHLAAQATGSGGSSSSSGGPVTPGVGAIVTVARVGAEAGSARLPDGGTVLLIDDGFEFGQPACTGSGCLAGGLTP